MSGVFQAAYVYTPEVSNCSSSFKYHSLSWPYHTTGLSHFDAIHWNRDVFQYGQDWCDGYPIRCTGNIFRLNFPNCVTKQQFSSHHLQVIYKQSVALAAGVYGVIALMAAVVAIMLPIETKGKEMPDRVPKSWRLHANSYFLKWTRFSPAFLHWCNYKFI